MHSGCWHGSISGSKQAHCCDLTVRSQAEIFPSALLRLMKVSDACEDNFVFDPEGLLYSSSNRGLVRKMPRPILIQVHVSSTTTSLISIPRSLCHSFSSRYPIHIDFADEVALTSTSPFLRDDKHNLIAKSSLTIQLLDFSHPCRHHAYREGQTLRCSCRGKEDIHSIHRSKSHRIMAGTLISHYRLKCDALPTSSNTEEMSYEYVSTTPYMNKH